MRAASARSRPPGGGAACRIVERHANPRFPRRKRGGPPDRRRGVGDGRRRSRHPGFGAGITVRALAEQIADEYGRRDLLRFGARPDNLVDPPVLVIGVGSSPGQQNIQVSRLIPVNQCPVRHGASPLAGDPHEALLASNC